MPRMIKDNLVINVYVSSTNTSNSPTNMIHMHTILMIVTYKAKLQYAYTNKPITMTLALKIFSKKE